MKTISKVIKESDFFPNNENLPCLLYKGVFDLRGKNFADQIKETFQQNSWLRPWVDAIYDFHHYHSNNHEALGIAKGTCTVILGGEEGTLFELEKGDVLILPAGVSHKRLKKSEDFTCVGAYSIDVPYDMKYGKPGEKEKDKKKIRSLPLPDTDPVFGPEGPLVKHWNKS